MSFPDPPPIGVGGGVTVGVGLGVRVTVGDGVKVSVGCGVNVGIAIVTGVQDDKRKAMSIILFMVFIMLSFYVQRSNFESLRILGSGVTVSVSCSGWEGGLAAETGKTQSQTKAQKTRRVPTVSCTLC